MATYIPGSIRGVPVATAKKYFASALKRMCSYVGNEDQYVSLSESISWSGFRSGARTSGHVALPCISPWQERVLVSVSAWQRVGSVMVKVSLCLVEEVGLFHPISLSFAMSPTLNMRSMAAHPQDLSWAASYPLDTGKMPLQLQPTVAS